MTGSIEGTYRNDKPSEDDVRERGPGGLLTRYQMVREHIVKRRTRQTCVSSISQPMVEVTSQCPIV